jgi:ribosomal protein S18 acetylase RimI-like enzyme
VAGDPAAVPAVEPTFRLARPSDAPAVAALHAESWRRTYRGQLTDAYLDDVVPGERAEEWARRLGGAPSAVTGPDEVGAAVLAEVDGALWGFAHVVADHDPELGSYLSALHVDHRARRRGLAARLLAEGARWLAAHATAPGMYLEVVEDNPTARAAYERLGGREVSRGTWHAPDGSAVVDLTYAWDDLAPLLARLPAGAPPLA